MQNHPSVLKSVKKITIDAESDDRRLDNFLTSQLRGVPRSHIYNLIRTGQVRVNRGRAKASRRLKCGDIVRIPPVVVQDKQRDAQASSKLITAAQQVLFEDEFMLVLEKPAGIAVHSGTRHNLGLIEAIRQTRPNEPNIELVHRLDKDTSGVLVLAKNKRSLRKMQSQWRREVDASALRKQYSALLMGQWDNQSPTIVESESALDNSAAKAHRRPAVAMSCFTPVRNFENCVLVEIELHTGKTHQARLHALQLGRPIAGDRKFGDREFNAKMRHFGLKRMFLHAREITMTHPFSNQTIVFEAELPPELSAVIDNLDNNEGN